MKRVVVDDSFWEVFPEAQIAVMYVDGIDNHDTDENKAERTELPNQLSSPKKKPSVIIQSLHSGVKPMPSFLSVRGPGHQLRHC